MPASGAPYAAEALTAKPILAFLICRVRLYHDAILGSLNREVGINAVGSIDIGAT